jgi:hypothetical protein
MTRKIERKQSSKAGVWSLVFLTAHVRSVCRASALEILPETLEVITRMTASQMWGDGLVETETWQGGFYFPVAALCEQTGLFYRPRKVAVTW